MDENHWLAVSTWPRLCTDDVNIVGLQIIHGLMYIANLVSPYTTHCQQQTGHFHNPHMGLKLKPPKEAKKLCYPGKCHFITRMPSFEAKLTTLTS